MRESLFSKLESAAEIQGARVLDLYAGTGALGLEAISRGCHSATLVEQNAAAASVVRENAELVHRALEQAGATAKIRVVQKSVQKFLSASTEEFDLVFSDPPYELSNSELERDFELLAKRLGPSALVVLERSSRNRAPGSVNFELFESRSYGDTALHFYRY